MKFPSITEVLSVLPDLEKKALKKPSLKMLSSTASPAERWKYQISKKLCEFKTKKNFSLDDLSKLFKTDKANLSRILRGYIENVSIEKLLGYLHIAIIASQNKNMAKNFEKQSKEFFELKEIRF